MQFDVAKSAELLRPAHTQVCVVGGGIAGIVLAHALARRGVSVALLEAGGLVPDDSSAARLERMAAAVHPGSLEAQARAFGGTSLRWGGQLLAPAALTERWPMGLEDIALYFRGVERLFGIDDRPYDAAAFLEAAGEPEMQLARELAGVQIRVSKWAPFSSRNVAATLGRELLTQDKARVYLHAPVCELLPDARGGRIEAALVRSAQGVVRFTADHFVVAAGAVESVRLLLASRSVMAQGVGNAHGQVGLHFHDHLTVSAATVTGPARSVLLRKLRPYIFEGTVHSFKMEAMPALCAELGMNATHAHMKLEDPPGSGLAAVRELLTSRQRGNMLSTLRERALALPGAAADAVQLAVARVREQRRYVPASTTVTLQLNAAQDAPSGSSLTLAEGSDARPVLEWRVTERELATLRAFSTHLRERMADFGLNEVTGLEWQPDLLSVDAESTARLRARLDDARHPMGGAVMGDDPATSVTGPTLAVHGIENLYVASTAVFPDGTPQLPTLTLLALTLRLAERLAVRTS